MKSIKEKKDSDLEKLLFENKKALRIFNFSFAGGKVKNTKEKRGMRKHIAQILTEINRRSRESQILK